MIGLVYQLANAALLLPWLARAALANEEMPHHEAGIPWSSLALSTINLVIFLAALSRFVLPALRDWVRERRDRVTQDLEAAATAKAEALKLRDEWQARMARLNDTIEQMRARARQDAELERQRLLAAAQKTAETIRRDAERTAAYQVRRAQEELRAELVRQALLLVEQNIHTQWSPADQDRFVADFLQQVQQ